MRSVVKINTPFNSPAAPDVPYPFSTYDVQAGLDEATGRIRYPGPVHFPSYLVVPQPPLAVTLRWEPIARASYLPATLVRVRRPLQATTTIAGLTPDGYVRAGTPVVMTV